MDEDEFDAFSKALASGSLRRQFLKLLAGAAAGGALTLFGFDARAHNEGRPRPCGDFGASCKGNHDCCGGTCCNGMCCPLGECFQGVRCIA